MDGQADSISLHALLESVTQSDHNRSFGGGGGGGSARGGERKGFITN